MSARSRKLRTLLEIAQIERDRQVRSLRLHATSVAKQLTHLADALETEDENEYRFLLNELGILQGDETRINALQADLLSTLRQRDMFFQLLAETEDTDDQD